MSSDASAAKLDLRRYGIWSAQDGRPRVLHVMLRVRDFEAAMRFYTEGFGMKPLGEPFDVEGQRMSAVCLGFDDGETGGCCLELVYYWDAEGPYTHGTGFGHISMGVPDIDELLGKLGKMGAKVTLPPRALVSGGPRVAYLEDLDGYAVELIETPGT